MMVAAGALKPLPKKELGRILDLLVDVLYLPIPNDRWVCCHLTAGCQNVGHKFVVGTVFQQSLTNPGMEGVASPPMQFVVRTLVTEDGRPLHGKVVRVVG